MRWNGTWTLSVCLLVCGGTARAQDALPWCAQKPKQARVIQAASVPPQALIVFDGSTGRGAAPSTQYLDGTNSTARSPARWIMSYQWDFGDGSPRSSAGWVEHTFQYPGSYVVSLTVTDELGGKGTQSVTVEVGERSTVQTAVAVAVFDGSTGQGPVPHDEYLDGTGSHSTVSGEWVTDFEWDFGDGSPVSHAPWVIHRYAKEGSYQIRLKVTDSLGSTATALLPVTVGSGVVPPPPPPPAPPVDAGSVPPSPPVDAGTPPPPPSSTDNPVSRENALVGDEGWKLTWMTDTGDLAGHLSTDSALAGEQVQGYVHSATQAPVRWELYRMGYYAGRGGRKLLTGTFTGRPQATCPKDATTGRVECRWVSSFGFTVSPDWVSGVYLVKLTRDPGQQTHLIFTVRDTRQAAVMVQQSVTTWQAYNSYGGESLYISESGLPDGHAVEVSFSRPYAALSSSGQFFEFEYDFVRWLESQGYDATYVTNLDFSRNPDTALRARVFLSVGHDEYWTQEQRVGLERARDRGVHQGYLTANAAYWQIRAGAGLSGAWRTVTCYKGSRDPVSDRSRATVQWRDPLLNRPENALLGVMFDAWQAVNVPLTVRAPTHWLFEGTGLAAGDSIPLLVGYESDRVFGNGATPAGTQVLAGQELSSTYALLSRHDLTLYTAPSGAMVLGTGTIAWGWGVGAPGLADARVQRMTSNFLARAGVVPRTPGTQIPTSNGWSRARYDGAASNVLTVARGLDRPTSVVPGAGGILYVLEAGKNRIVRVDGSQTLLIAGGTEGGANGTGAAAQFSRPHALAMGPDGALYVADTANSCIRKVTLAGVVSTFAGSCGSEGLVDGATASARFNHPQGLAFAPDGSLYVADTANHVLRRIASGRVSTLAAGRGRFQFPTSVTVGANGTVYLLDSLNREVVQVSSSGQLRSLVSQAPARAPYMLPDRAGGGFMDGAADEALAMPGHGIAVSGNALYFSDAGNNRVRKVDLVSGRVSTLAGSGRGVCEDGTGATSAFVYPQGLALGGPQLYVADSCGAVRRISLP